MNAAPTTLHIVVGIDDRPAGWAALRQATDLARRLGARLDVVHIVGLDAYAGVVPAGLEFTPVPMDTPEQRAAIAESTQRLQADTDRVLDGSGLDWVFHSRPGEPGQVLAELAEDCDAYCIVVGTRGEGFKAFLSRLVQPSVSHALLRDRHRPVLVVAPDSEE